MRYACKDRDEEKRVKGYSIASTVVRLLKGLQVLHMVRGMPMSSKVYWHLKDLVFKALKKKVGMCGCV